jgi:hypothetical protein
LTASLVGAFDRLTEAQPKMGMKVGITPSFEFKFLK